MLWSEAEAIVEEEQEQRLQQVCAVATLDGEVVGVASGNNRVYAPIQRPLYYIRSFVSEKHRLRGIAETLVGHVAKYLEQKFNSGDPLGCIGVWIELQAAYVADLTQGPVVFELPDADGCMSPFYLVQIFIDPTSGKLTPHYVHYFEKASLFEDGPIDHPKKIPAAEDAYDLIYCLNNLAESDKKAICQLWLEEGVMPDLASCRQRLDSVAAIAKKGGRVIGVGSVFSASYPGIRYKVMGYRSFIRPEARGGATATKLLKLVCNKLEQAYHAGVLWDHPGVAIMLQNDRLNLNVAAPCGPDLQTVLVGYENGAQVRIKYFEGAEVKRSGLILGAA